MSTKAKWSSGVLTYFDGSTFETTGRLAPICFYDDFLGADVAIPASGSAESGVKWTKKIVSSNSTVAGVADETNGVIACALAANSEKEDAVLHMNDELLFSLAQGVIFEARIKLSVLPSAAASIASWGLWGAWADGGSAYRVGFEAAGSGAISCESDDNATDTSAASGVTVLNTDWKIYRIDCTNQASIKFFINGVPVCTSTTFNNAASASNSKCQPHIGMYKASGTSVGTIQVDYVKVWQNRA